MLLRMECNGINISKLQKTCHNLENLSSDIINNLNRIGELVDRLAIVFKDDETVKICDEIKNYQIITLKSYCSKIYNMKVVLEKVGLAYLSLDEKFSTNINIAK